jgi:hypothetical protein
MVNLVSSKSGSSLASLAAGSFPFSNFFRRRLSSSSSALRPRFDGGGLLYTISSSRWLKICSGGSRGGISEKDDKLMEEVGESKGGRGSYIDKTRNR